MKKTVNVNISGIVFHIEEEAYDILQTYLHAIEKNFRDESERKEIMRDIEARIAELFQGKNTLSKEVITDVDVEDVIKVMGEPEDYISEDYDNVSEENRDDSYQSENSESSKRLFRDKDNAQIAGVCGGLAAYIGVDPVVVRIVFVIMMLLGLSGGFVYLILMFVMPEAKTSNDKLKMHGKPINVNSIKETAKDIKDSLKNGTQKKHFGSTISNAVEKGVQSSSKFVKGFSRILGFVFLLGGVFALLILIGVFIGDGGLIPFWGERQSITLNEGMDILYASPFQSSLTFGSIIMVLILPILGMIYTGIRLLFEIKPGLKYFRLSLTVLWIVSLGVLSFTSILLGLEFRDEASITDYMEIDPATEVLKIEVTNDDVFSNKIDRAHNSNLSNMIDVSGDMIYLGYPKLIIVESNKDSTYKVEIHKSSRGINEKEAIMNSELMKYECGVKDGVLNLAPYMSMSTDEKFRGQELEILVRVPEGKSVVLGENIERVLQPISAKNISEQKRQLYSNTEWKNDSNKMVFVDH
jgi:phage shock protein PspC (stress-responsive transcriptional regulator)